MPLRDKSDLAWCVIDGTAVFLDIAADRYFRLAGAQNLQFIAELGGGCANYPHQPACFPLPGTWAPPLRRSKALDEGPFRLDDVARALWLQKRVERRLEQRSLAAVLHELHGALDAPSDQDAAQCRRASREVRAFEQARLLRAAADRCLPRSIALALSLARHRCRATVVLGVKLAPFAAHCWAQERDEVLNDEVEEVLRYTPILIL